MSLRNSPEPREEVLAQHIHPEVSGWHKLFHPQTGHLLISVHPVFSHFEPLEIITLEGDSCSFKVDQAHGLATFAGLAH